MRPEGLEGKRGWKRRNVTWNTTRTSRYATRINEEHAWRDSQAFFRGKYKSNTFVCGEGGHVAWPDSSFDGTSTKLSSIFGRMRSSAVRVVDVLVRAE